MEAAMRFPKNLLNTDRLALCDTRLPANVTCIVDGLPIYTHGSDALYNGKKRRKYYTTQIYVSLNGDPLTYTSLVHGRTHDSTAAAAEQPWTPHLATEIFLADLAYINNPHCLTQYKKRRAAPLLPSEILFNKVVAHRRARIERWLAYFCRHRHIRECKHRKWYVEGAVQLVWLGEIVIHQASGTRARYETVAARTVPLDAAACGCTLEKLQGSPERVQMRQIRDDLAATMFADEVAVREEIVPRRPAQA